MDVLVQKLVYDDKNKAQRTFCDYVNDFDQWEALKFTRKWLNHIKTVWLYHIFFLLCPNFLKVANITDPAAVTLFVSGGANWENEDT